MGPLLVQDHRLDHGAVGFHRLILDGREVSPEMIDKIPDREA